MGLVVIAVGLFWCIFFFDIIGDMYGSTAGGVAILVPTVGCLLLRVFLVAVLRSCWENSSENCLGSGSRLGTAETLAATSAVSSHKTVSSNPMNSDFALNTEAAL